MKISELEAELRKRLLFDYKWGLKQNDILDRKTNFIYKIFYLEELIAKLETEFKNDEDYLLLENYAMNRWFNYWSARGVEALFCKFPNVEAEKNPKNKTSDFTINGIKFDLKTTGFPKNYKHDLTFALNNKRDLIYWLYKNQSGEQRRHFKNRLFLVLYNCSGENWKLKAEISRIKKIITPYVENFNESNLEEFILKGEERTFSDIIWCVNSTE